MKQKHFYSHLITLDSLHMELSTLQLDPKEKEELVSIAEVNVHHVVLDSVLSELSEPEKKQFLLHLTKEKHEDIWKLLKEKNINIEEKIKNIVENMLESLNNDIKNVLKKNV
jgi:hypothetical protein